jgi:hypothetical protein
MRDNMNMHQIATEFLSCLLSEEEKDYVSICARTSKRLERDSDSCER